MVMMAAVASPSVSMYPPPLTTANGGINKAAPQGIHCQLLHSSLNGRRLVFNSIFKSNSNSKFRSFSVSSTRCELTPALKTSLDKVVTSNKVVLFMKGTKDFPQCGFSNTVVQILKSFNVPFETINILENELLRQGLKEYSSWPTFPQLYIDGEFFGGCDITVEAYKSGQLQEVLEKAMCS